MAQKVPASFQWVSQISRSHFFEGQEHTTLRKKKEKKRKL
jgi:hypothetical protein